jgi:adenylyltransferase/sulfurtransferase
MTLSPKENLRYDRHLILPDFGRDGQLKLKAASVLIVGAGGLGSPLAMYLAAAGIGRLGIVDFDEVDETNLQRQILHGSNDVGRLKIDSAKDRIVEINPHVEVELHSVRLTSDNALSILAEYDVVADGTDNFPTRYLINDACVLLGKPNVYASIFRFEGQVSVFGHDRGPCYRCLYPEPPPPALIPSCAEGGVLGVLPGVVGSLQALEVIKLIVGIGEPLVGRVLFTDTLTSQFNEMSVDRDIDCAVCGENPTVSGLVDYDSFCQTSNPLGSTYDSSIPEISVADYVLRCKSEIENFILVDVRGVSENEAANMGGICIPLDELSRRSSELRNFSDKDIILHCRSGVRSSQAAKLLIEIGFKRVFSLSGGMLAWQKSTGTGRL